MCDYAMRTNSWRAVLISGFSWHPKASEKTHLEKSTPDNPECPSPDEFEFVRRRLAIFLLLLAESSALPLNESFSNAGPLNPNPMSSSPESLSPAFVAACLPPPPLVSASNGACFVFFWSREDGGQNVVWFARMKTVLRGEHTVVRSRRSEILLKLS